MKLITEKAGQIKSKHFDDAFTNCFQRVLKACKMVLFDFKDTHSCFCTLNLINFASSSEHSSNIILSFQIFTKGTITQCFWSYAVRYLRATIGLQDISTRSEKTEMSAHELHTKLIKQILEKSHKVFVCFRTCFNFSALETLKIFLLKSNLKLFAKFFRRIQNFK